MAEVFNFELGIQVVDNNAEEQLGKIITQVGTLSTSVTEFNKAVGLSGFTEDLGKAAQGLEHSFDKIMGKSVELKDIFGESAGKIEKALAAVGISEEGPPGAEGGPVTAAEAAGVSVAAEVDTASIEKGVTAITESSDDLKTAMTGDLAGIQKSAEELDKELQQKPKDIKKIEEAAEDAEETVISSFTEMLGAAHDFHGAINAMRSEILDLALGPAMELERSAVRITASMGESRESADKYVDTVNELSQRTGLAEVEMGAMAAQLAMAGFRLEEFSNQDQDAFAHLVGNLRVSAEEARAFQASASLMGASVHDLMSDAAEFQEQFGVPGIIEQMPAVTENAIKAQAAFGTSVVKDAKKASKGVARSAALIAKSLGKTATEAAQDAMNMFNKFAGETRSYQDVFLGLADDFSPLQTAFLEAGVGVERMGQLMEDAQTNPQGFVDEVLRIQQGLDPHMAERFFQQVLRDADPAMQAMLTQRVARERMTKAQLEAAEKEDAIRKRRESGVNTLNKMMEAMRGNVLDTFAKFSSRVENLFNQVQRIFGPGLTKGFENLFTAMETVVGYFDQAEEGLKGNETRMARFNATVGLVTTAVVGASTAFGGVASALASLGVFLKPAWSLLGKFGGGLKKILGISSKVGGKVGFLGKGLKLLGGVFKKLFWPIGALFAVFEGFGDKVVGISDAIEKGDIGGAFNLFLAGAWDSIDAFFLGLPGKFIDGFKSMGRGVETEGAKTFGQTVGKILGDGLSAAVDWLASTGAPAMSDAVSALFTVDFWYGVLSGFAALGHQLIAAVGGMAEGFMNAFGLPIEAFVPMMEIAWLKVQKAVTVSLMSIGDLLMMSVSGWEMIFNDLGAGIDKMWAGVKHSAMSAVLGMLAGIADKMAKFAEEHPFMAKIFGGAEAAKKMQASVKAAQDTLDIAHKVKLAQIEKERVADEDAIKEAQKAREEETAKAAAAFDKKIAAKQEEMNKLAELRAQEEAAENQRQIAAQREVETAKRAREEKAEAAKIAIASTDEGAFKTGLYEAGVGPEEAAEIESMRHTDPAKALQFVEKLKGALDPMMAERLSNQLGLAPQEVAERAGGLSAEQQATFDRLTAAMLAQADQLAKAGDFTSARGAHEQLKELRIRMEQSSDAGTLLERALQAWSVAQVNGKSK